MNNDLLEKYLAEYADLKKQTLDNNFLRGQLLSKILDMGVKLKWLSAQTGDSLAQIRELVKTYRAFPDEGMRIPELSWYHHRLAANTSDPVKWINRAFKERLSTRQLRNMILEEEIKNKKKAAAKKAIPATKQTIDRLLKENEQYKNKIMELEKEIEGYKKKISSIATIFINFKKELGVAV